MQVRLKGSRVGLGWIRAAIWHKSDGRRRGAKPTSRPRRGSGAVAGGRGGGGRGHFVKRQIRAFARGANVRFTLDFTG